MDRTPPTGYEVRSVVLPRGRRGYDERAVEDLLERVARELDRLHAVTADLRRENHRFKDAYFAITRGGTSGSVTAHAEDR